MKPTTGYVAFEIDVKMPLRAPTVTARFVFGVLGHSHRGVGVVSLSTAIFPLLSR
jgi:hypothetical protein